MSFFTLSLEKDIVEMIFLFAVNKTSCYSCGSHNPHCYGRE